MRTEGYEIKRRGKSLEFRAPGQLKFTRFYRLGDGYDEAGLNERIEQKEQKQEKKLTEKLKPNTTKKNVNLLIDIQEKIREGKGKGYEHWAAVFNVEEAANTLNFLTEHGVTDYDELTKQAEEAGAVFDKLSARIKQLEGQMEQTAQLKMYIINYSKTRDIYVAYQKSGRKKISLTSTGKLSKNMKRRKPLLMH